MSDDDNEVFYRLDRANRIIEVGGAWDRFANENDGGHLAAGSVLGTNLLDHVSGDATRYFLRSALNGVRRRGAARERRYRCDSPVMERVMGMVIEAEADGGLKVRHRLLQTRRVEPVLAYKIAAAAMRPGELIVRCSFCLRLRRRNKWLEPEEAIREWGLATSKPLEVAYGVCPVCRAAAKQRAGAFVIAASAGFTENVRAAASMSGWL